ncbi:MAG: sulfurtransferase [Actinobacteria bacterium]|nr:sulfurtransferase [Actinomycetota bacterium]
MTVETVQRSHVLMDTERLAARLDDSSIAIVEVDEDSGAFAVGHIPGAVSFDWRNELHALPRRDFVSREQLADLLGAKGISAEQTIVLYGGNNNWFAAYAYWLFKLRGVSKVKLLDGGRMKWELEDRPMTAAEKIVKPGRFVIGPENPELRALRAEVIEAAGGQTKFVDVRSPGEFSGEVLAPPHLPQEQPYVGGHIPGASNIPWSQAANEDGTFRSLDQLRALYESKHITSKDPVIAYCRIGERAAHTWFALSELLGYPNVKNYDGSWTEYGSLVGVPVNTGPET